MLHLLAATCHMNISSKSIIFDGYNSSTEDQEHERRTNTKFTDVILELHNDVQCKQSEFLPNRINKTQFIKRLSETLEAHSHTAVAKYSLNLLAMLFFLGLLHVDFVALPSMGINLLLFSRNVLGEVDFHLTCF